MQLLISDANIFIDLDVCGILEQMFELPFEFAVPDILYMEELEEHHGDLPRYGLQIKKLNSQSIEYVSSLQTRYNGPSDNDFFAFVLAKQEECPLITGDAQLRKVAVAEGVKLKGTIWIIEQFVKQRLMSPDDALDVFELMKSKGRRLPWDLAKKSIEQLKF